MFIHFGEGNHKEGVNPPGEGTWLGGEKAGQKALRCFLALLLLGDLNFSDPQSLFLWNGDNNTKCSREGDQECFVIRLLLQLGWLHFIRWDHGLCRLWNIMQGLLNSSASWKYNRVCLPCIHNLEENWEERTCSRLGVPLCLWPFMNIVLFLLLCDVSLMDPFYRWGRQGSERLCESLRATQPIRGLWAWILGCLMQNPLCP